MKKNKKEINTKTKKLTQYHEDFQKIPVMISTTYEGQTYDILLHAWMGKVTGWLSPAALGLSSYDWLAHLAIAPVKQTDLMQKGWKSLIEFYLIYMAKMGIAICQDEQLLHHKPRESDSRFKDEGWQQFPFNLYSDAFLLFEQWWNEATSSIRGVSKHHEQVVNFVARQILDMIAPSNFIFTNPEVLNVTFKEGGTNFLKGYNNFVDDLFRINYKLPPAGTENFKVGINVAITQGKVIYKNNLIELIQYEPTTKNVYVEPVLITPAWIMKYYILDLSPHNSLVKYLVDKGHTVFIISWKNPTSEDRGLALEDYLHLGIMKSLDVIGEIFPNTKVHTVGYCLGGTLLMIAAAAMAGANDERLISITLFAAQIDFRDPGELSLFIDQSQISYLEDIMWEKGYLDGNQMSWAFSMLRSSDLIWSRMIHDYLLGKRRPMSDLMAWDNDTTRLPFKMHSDYLHNLFLKNELVQGHYEVNKKRIALTDINVPIFVVATIKDHVSPWRSVYKVALFTNTDITFVLTNGGHNAGIVSEPGHKGRSYQMLDKKRNDKHISSNTWLERAPKYKGSWWPAWENWLVNLSEPQKIKSTEIGETKGHKVICDAPGDYVLQK